MLKVMTFFRHNRQFLPLDEFKGPVLDPRYIEGALSVTIYEKELFGITQWDYIDQLWAYIVDGVFAITAGEPYSCYFPDQPIRIAFEILSGNQVKIFVEAGSGRTGVVDREIFISVFGQAAMQFFLRMKTLVPEDSDIFNDYIRKLSDVIVVK